MFLKTLVSGKKISSSGLIHEKSHGKKILKTF